MTTRTGLPPDFYPTDLEPVPTVASLVAKGLARALERKKDGSILIARIDPGGYRLIAEVSARNAERMRARLPR